MISPSNFTSAIKIMNLDLQKAITKFESDPKYFIAMGVLKIENKTFQTAINSEVFTNGILASEFDGKASYSLGLTVSEGDIQGFEILNDLLIAFINDTAYEITNPIKNEKLYLKLKAGNKSFNTVSNIKLNPAKFQDSGIYRGQPIQAICDFSVYVNVREKKAGIVVTPKKLIFEI
jgi:hypothetical protein